MYGIDGLTIVLNRCFFVHFLGTDMMQLQAGVPLEGDVDVSKEGFTKMITSRTPFKDVTIHDIIWCSVYNMSSRIADSYRKGRVFLAGDSAHIHPPTGGQGLNTSVQDAYNLGWKLAAVLKGAPSTLLDSYELERRTIAAGMIGMTTELLKSLSFNRGRNTQQLDLNYRDSSLSFTKSSTHTESIRRAGDRAPDAPCLTKDGQATCLFDVMKGPQWTLLGYEVEDNLFREQPRHNLNIFEIGVKGDIVDNNHHIRDGYKLAPHEWVLIRPDGYIAGFVLNKDSKDLIQYMDEVVGLAKK